MDSLPLNGEWRCALDRDDVGLKIGWADRALAEARAVALPGSLAVQRLGDPVDARTPWTGTVFDPSYFTAPEYAPYRPPAPVKFPCWLTPDNVFVGAAWYEREIEIPAAWVGRRVVLVLERPHWETRAWLDGRSLGVNDSLAAPHRFELGVFAAPGRHRLTLRVDNRLIVNVGENAHSVSDHTQGNWNGVIGRIELQATAAAWIERLEVLPMAATNRVIVRGEVKTLPGAVRPANVSLAVPSCAVRAETAVEDDGAFATELSLGSDAARWDEFSPALHESEARLENGEVRLVRFGLREVRAEGQQLLINGRPLFLRGTLDCAVFPQTGHPPMEPGPWREIFSRLRECGLNHVRFHSWCPPQAAFVAADELGFYLQVECGAWANTMLPPSITRAAAIGDGATLDAWIYAEGERLLREFGHHPSFVLLAHGNEPGGQRFAEFLAEWVRHFRRAAAGRCLVTAAAGWPEIPESELLVVPEPRLHQWGDGLRSRLNASEPATVADFRTSVEKRAVPLVSHEIGQWCAFPTLNDGARYTGHLRPGNHEIFADWLAARGLKERLQEFVHASGRLQVLCYKEEIETQLRTPGLGGFQLLGLQDFPGQGTAPVGVLDAFWQTKPYVAPAELRRFCGPSVLLARLPRRVFSSGETLTATLELAHYGAAALIGAEAWWRVETEAGEVVARGEFAARDVPLGSGRELGALRVKFGDGPARRLRLVAGVANTGIENDWDLWVFPSEPIMSAPRGVHVARELDAAAEAVLRAGGCVVLSGGVGCGRGDARGRVELGFTPIFWNTACTQRQAPHTLGVCCDPAHPALAGFPTGAHTDWQWWYLLNRADALILDDLPAALRPIVGAIDDWYTNRRLGLVFEAKVGAGRLLVSSVDLENGLESNPVARQFRASLLAYAASAAFAPSVEVGLEAVRAVWKS